VNNINTQNNRAFTTDRNDLQNKNFCDLLYLILLSLSDWDGENRYVKKKNFTKGQLAKICGISPNTMTKKFKELLSTEEGKIPFLVEEKDRYVFTDRAAFILVPAETIEWLLIYNQIPEDTFKIYAYLANKFFFEYQEKSFGFTITELLNVLGYNTSAHNNKKIVAKLELLYGIGMLDYEFAASPKKGEDGKFTYTHILKRASKTPNRKMPNDQAFNELYQEILQRSKQKVVPKS
jgi:hypothetical protein